MPRHSTHPSTPELPTFVIHTHELSAGANEEMLLFAVSWNRLNEYFLDLNLRIQHCNMNDRFCKLICRKSIGICRPGTKNVCADWSRAHGCDPDPLGTQL